MTKTNEKAVIHWDLCARFRNKEQAVSFITEQLKSEISPNDISFSEMNDRYEVSIVDMAWATNLVITAELLQKLDLME